MWVVDLILPFINFPLHKLSYRDQMSNTYVLSMTCSLGGG
jgi:hypothetical protein